MLTVHHLEDSRSQRILWLLEELSQPYAIEYHRRDPITRAAPAALRNIHPLGKSPIIVDAGKIIAETGAIVDYILRRYGMGRMQPPIFHDDYDLFVHWMHYAEGSAMPALAMRLQAAKVGDAAKALIPELDAELSLHLTYLDKALNGRPYLLGEQLSAADIQLSFFGEVARAIFGVLDYRHIHAWIERFQARAAYQVAIGRGGAYRFAS